MPPEGLITCGHGYMHIFTHRACEQRQANTLLQHVVVPLLAHLLLEVWALQIFTYLSSTARLHESHMSAKAPQEFIAAHPDYGYTLLQLVLTLCQLDADNSQRSTGRIRLLAFAELLVPAEHFSLHQTRFRLLQMKSRISSPSLETFTLMLCFFPDRHLLCFKSMSATMILLS